MKRVLGNVGWHTGKLNTVLRGASSEEEELFEGEKCSGAETVDVTKNMVVHTCAGNVSHHSMTMGHLIHNFRFRRRLRSHLSHILSSAEHLSQKCNPLPVKHPRAQEVQFFNF